MTRQDERLKFLIKAFAPMQMSHEGARVLIEYLDKLIAHRDQTVNLWATDRKDLVKDEKNVLFQIKFNQ